MLGYDGWDGTRGHGCGMATKRAAEACHDLEGKLQIFSNLGFSHPNGHSWRDWELVCGQCGLYSYVCTFREG